MKRPTKSKTLSAVRKPKNHHNKIADKLVGLHEKNESLRNKKIKTSFFKLF